MQWNRCIGDRLGGSNIDATGLRPPRREIKSTTINVLYVTGDRDRAVRVLTRVSDASVALAGGGTLGCEQLFHSAELLSQFSFIPRQRSNLKTYSLKLGLQIAAPPAQRFHIQPLGLSGNNMCHTYTIPHTPIM